MKKIDIHWLVGLLEGEGCFLAALSRNIRSGRRYAHARIDLAMTDLDIIRRAAGIMGANVIRQTYKRKPSPVTGKPYKPIYKFCVYSHRAEEWMTRLQPFMGRRRKAQIAKVLKRLTAARKRPWGKRNVR